MNEIVPQNEHPVAAHMPQAAIQRGTTPEAWHVMRTVLFPGASDEILCTLLDYCKARKLDPLKRPFHVVKVYDSEQQKMVESIWPSIGELRTTAMRTGQYAGKSEIEFGETVTQKVGTGDKAAEVTFPQWARCKVYRIVGGERVEFAGSQVFWLEAYASTRNGVPNAMWRKRPYGQLAKCAEAEALRSAFPEETGGDPTAEEMGDQPRYGPSNARDVTPQAETPKRDLRSELQAQATGDAEPAHDPDTGEVHEAEAEPQPEKPATNGNGGTTLWRSEQNPEQHFEKRSDAVRALLQDIEAAPSHPDDPLTYLMQLEQQNADLLEAVRNNPKAAKATNQIKEAFAKAQAEIQNASSNDDLDDTDQLALETEQR